MKQLKVEKRGCWGTIDGVFQELPVGHQFAADDVPPAFVGRVSVIGDVGEQELEIPSQGDNPAEQPEQPDTTTKSKKAK